MSLFFRYKYKSNFSLQNQFSVAPEIEKTGSKIVAKEGEKLVIHCR